MHHLIDNVIYRTVLNIVILSKYKLWTGGIVYGSHKFIAIDVVMGQPGNENKLNRNTCIILSY